MTITAPAPFYARLSRFTGIIFALIGVVFFLSGIAGVFTQSQNIPTNDVGRYFICFSGAAMVAWGLILMAGARDAALAAKLALPHAIGMALMAAYRAIITLASAEIAQWSQNVPLGEAVALAVLAVLFYLRRPAGNP